MYFGSAQYESWEAGAWRTETIPAPPGQATYGLLLATATDSDGNTSEFTNQFVFLPEPGAVPSLAAGVLLLRVMARRKSSKGR